MDGLELSAPVQIGPRHEADIRAAAEAFAHFGSKGLGPVARAETGCAPMLLEEERRAVFQGVSLGC
jgi:hypothetical protein